MRLEEIDLGGLGAFTAEKCGFRVDRYHLDEPWSYIYATSRVLLKVDQHGPDYLQFSPPGGTLLFKRERYQAHPSCFVWIKTAENRAFSNFYCPTVGTTYSVQEPDGFCCEYTPDKAVYHLDCEGLTCRTELFIPQSEAVMVMTVELANPGMDARGLEILPVLRPHMAAYALAPWDVPSLYQTVGYSNDKHQLFHIELRSPAGVASLREYAFVMTDIDSPDEVEINYSSLIGRGTFEMPEALFGKLMSISGESRYRFGHYGTENSVTGEQGIIACRKRLWLEPGETFRFTIVMGCSDIESNGVPSAEDEITRFSSYFDSAARNEACRASMTSTDDFISKRRICTPDEAFNRYVEEFLPLQLKWVSILDRGWPTGLRGVRDCAQDATALIPLDPVASRKTLLMLFDVQRSDGWFPRQYSIKGRDGSHDLRNYVDGGVWVWELLYDYLCHTKDFALLREEAAFLDCDQKASIILHILSLIEYYLDRDNLGEHNLCLIREGDWNDSINRAGLEGRGESVMVSCQAVLMLRQAARLFRYLADNRVVESELSRDELLARAAEFIRHADRFQSDILAHALNDEGYLNGLFNDDGKWIFSPLDPDGVRRINIPVNAFGIISGVLTEDNLPRVLEILSQLKQADGWPLFCPGIGNPPIEKLGRLGQGDLIPGLAENGTSYNHGCHGFFGRAAALAGRGDLLLDILKYMLPYDQDAHPVHRSKTAPYGVVNHWKAAPGLEGRGGDCFLSGSISTALRNVYNGLFGIRPVLDALVLDPCLPLDWDDVWVGCSYLGADLEITYRQEPVPNSVVIVNGMELTEKRVDEVTGKEHLAVPDAVFASGGRFEIIYNSEKKEQCS